MLQENVSITWKKKFHLKNSAFTFKRCNTDMKVCPQNPVDVCCLPWDKQSRCIETENIRFTENSLGAGTYENIDFPRGQLRNKVQKATFTAVFKFYLELPTAEVTLEARGGDYSKIYLNENPSLPTIYDDIKGEILSLYESNGSRNSSRSSSRIENFNIYPVTVVYSLLYERTNDQFQLYLGISASYTWGVIPSYRFKRSNVNTYPKAPIGINCTCDKTITPDYTGRPINFKSLQRDGFVLFELTDNSKCEEAFSFTRSDTSVEFTLDPSSSGKSFTNDYYAQSKSDCGGVVTPGTEAADDLSISRLSVGKVYQ